MNAAEGATEKMHIESMRTAAILLVVHDSTLFVAAFLYAHSVGSDAAADEARLGRCRGTFRRVTYGCAPL